MLPWLHSFCGDIGNDVGKAVDFDGLLCPATDVPLLFGVLGQCKNESNANNNNSEGITRVKITTAIARRAKFTQT